MSSVQFFTQAANLSDERQVSRAQAAERQRLWGRFQAQLAGALSDARTHGYPCCPVKADQVVEHGGVRYALEWLHLRFDLLAPTGVSSVRVTSQETGRAVTYGQVIRKERRSRKTARVTVRYHTPVGNFGGMDEVAAALAQDAHGQEVAS